MYFHTYYILFPINIKFKIYVYGLSHWHYIYKLWYNYNVINLICGLCLSGIFHLNIGHKLYVTYKSHSGPIHQFWLLNHKISDVKFGIRNFFYVSVYSVHCVYECTYLNNCITIIFRYYVLKQWKWNIHTKFVNKIT